MQKNQIIQAIISTFKICVMLCFLIPSTISSAFVTSVTIEILLNFFMIHPLDQTTTRAKKFHLHRRRDIQHHHPGKSPDGRSFVRLRSSASVQSIVDITTLSLLIQAELEKIGILIRLDLGCYSTSKYTTFSLYRISSILEYIV